jgi:hypothetical protein
MVSINYLQSGGLITNYYCSSKCGHCLYASSPQWEKRYISKDQAAATFEKMISLGCCSIHIGGGEPFLRKEGLEGVLEAARETGMGVEYVETNSSWFTGEEKAITVLSRLKDRGLYTLLISISPFHNAYIPFSKVKGVIRACQTTRLGIFPWVQEFVSDLSVLDEDKKHSMEEFEQQFGKGYLASLPSRYWITYGGRALKTFKNELPQVPLEEVLDAPGCQKLFQTSHFHIDLFGNYIPGLCSGMAIALKDLGGTISKEKYPLINTLYETGIRGFLDWAKQEHGFQPEPVYTGKCHLCFEIRKFLVIEKQFPSRELQPSEFYSRI